MTTNLIPVVTTNCTQEIKLASYTWAKVIHRYNDSAGGGQPFQDVFIAAALERAVGSINEESKVVGEKGAQGVGRTGWCLRTRFLVRDWRDGGDIQDSNAATATGVSDGTRREIGRQ